MLIPQRATLFGWAMLFPILILLYRAVEEKSTLYFAAAGVLAGGLPLIHTHSFLALGVMCAGFVILTMRKNAKEAKEFTIPVWGRFLLREQRWNRDLEIRHRVLQSVRMA